MNPDNLRRADRAADLMHWAHANGQDFQTALDDARMHFDESLTTPETMNTPLTDAEEYQTWSSGNYGMGSEYAENVVDSDFARRLETDRHALLEALENLLSEYGKNISSMRIDAPRRRLWLEACAARDKVTNQR